MPRICRTTSRPCSTPGPAGAEPRRHGRNDLRPRIRAGAHARGRSGRSAPPPPTSPTGWRARPMCPSREAHHIAGQAVARPRAGNSLDQLGLDELKSIDPRIDARPAAPVGRGIGRRAEIGWRTAPERVREAIAAARAEIAARRGNDESPGHCCARPDTCLLWPGRRPRAASRQESAAETAARSRPLDWPRN